MFDPVGWLDALDSREKAILLWVLALSGLACLNSDIRSSFGNVMRALAAPKLLVAFTSAALYSAFALLVAGLVGLWHTTSLKEAVFWFGGVGLILVGAAIRVGADGTPFRRVLKPALTLTIVVEFVVTLYVFPIAIELLFVPFVALLVVMSAVAGRDAKLSPARKAVDATLAAIGVLLLFFATIRAMGDLDGLFSAETAEDFLVSPALTLAFVPFLYVLARLSALEQARIARPRRRP